MNNIPVTCCIPVRNGAATLERAAHSAHRAGCDFILAYDDHSTDSTLLTIMALWPNVRRIGSEDIKHHAGVNFARNYLISHAVDSLIIPLDVDDELLDIRPLVQAWQPGTWVYGDYVQREGLEETLIPGSPAGMLSRKELTGISFMFHKDDWLKVGGYDPDFAYCEDYAFQCALTHAGIQPVYVPTPVYRRHLKANGNERTSRAGEYWNFYHLMARRKYPSVFAVNR